MKTECSNCIHAKEGELGQDLKRQLVCRRYPPTPFAIPAQGGLMMMQVYPQIKSDDLCGEFKLSLNLLN